MDISNCWFYAGKILDVIDRFHCTWVDVVENFNVGEHFSCQGYRVDVVKGISYGGSIE